MIRLCLFILLIFVTTVQCKMFHEYLTPREKMALFQTTDEVIEYEVVPVVHGVQKRSLKNYFSVVFLKVFGSDLHLYLEPTDGILAGNETKIWIAEPDDSNPDRVKYELISNAANTNFKTYHDLLNMAAVTIEKDDSDNLLMDGTIGSDLGIRPVPTRLHKFVSNMTREKRGIDLSLEGLKNITNVLKNTIPHIIFKKPNIKENKGVVEPHSSLKNLLKNRINRFLPPKGGTVYPEVMVFMDHPLFQIFENDIEAVKRYILSFWNGVDLRFRLMGDPSVRINIAGIILSAGKSEVGLLKKSYVEEGLIDGDRVLIEIGQNLYNETTFIHQKDYDLFIVMTKRDICNYDGGSFCSNIAMGYAYVSSACFVNETTKMVEAVGIIEDSGGFAGIVPCAHEVGHLLGATHDETPDPGITEKKCQHDDGYIMAGAFSMHENGFEWSNCSQIMLNDYLNSNNASCLRNKPNVDNPLPRVLPGVHLTLAEQCQRIFENSYPCAVDENVCVQLLCYNPEEGFCDPKAPAAEGSSCGENSICINGKCISKQSTVVPRSHNRTFLDEYGYDLRDIVPKVKSYFTKWPFFS